MTIGKPQVGVSLLLFTPPNEPKRKILLGERISNHEGGRYGCPGGKVEGGETIYTAMARELWEETRLRTARPVRPLGLVANCTYKETGLHFVNFWFFANVYSEDVEKHGEYVEINAEGQPKNKGWGWYSREQIKTLPMMCSTAHAFDLYESMAYSMMSIYENPELIFRDYYL